MNRLPHPMAPAAFTPAARFGASTSSPAAASARLAALALAVASAAALVGLLTATPAWSQAAASAPASPASPASPAASNAPTAPAAQAAAPATSVQTARLDSVWLQPERSAAATVLARNESRLSAEVAGTVQRWSADVGATVRRGELLLQIDPTDHELALQRAQAGRDAAMARLQLGLAQLQRGRDLVAQGFFSKEALTQRETEVALQQADLASAEAQLRSARRQLARTRVLAPFAGTVVQRTAQVGEAVAPGTPLFVLVEGAAAELQAHVPPAELPGLRRAGAWQFQPQGSPALLDLRLLRASPTIQTANRAHAVRLGWTPAAAAAAATSAPPGSSGVLRWRDPQPHIPAALLVRRGSELGIFVRQGQQARFVALPGAQEGRAAPTDLPPDTLLVVRGQAALSHGQALN
ncbi:efflux RND transporter periplasmic adaptor subunit [Serpentinimonas barnesii]|uniref:efflux RND transporter periplasmic adaptor subunit n=1 Tax=Serpentinimonas barnesii TaxID=1458427 RepID=UPI0006935C39|nr:efflux RND transporter periplasmic adaptor subunit [Serpentinimonas barnesii]